MKNHSFSIKNLVFLICFVVFLSCKEQKTIQQEVAIIPTPVEQKIEKGSFVWDTNVSFEADKSLQPASDLLKGYIKNSLSISESKGSKKVQFILNNNLTSKEGYHLTVTENTITISAKNVKGAFNAVQTLRQLLPPCIEDNSCKDAQIAVQALTIKDEPAFAYRGMHLDVGRHMFSVDFIKQYIDRMALLKMNTFHWHLTEDQGWRIEIKKYPKLNEIAAYRSETVVGHNNSQPQKFDGKRYGGYYTQEQVKDIVSYATARGITVIPEIEMPGHSQAAIAAYPNLGCTGEQVEVATKWGVFEDIYCTKEETFEFLEDVLDEVLALFPSKYIHIGGDEAPKTRWKKCAHCQKRIKEEGLKDEHELQNYFITRMEKYLNGKGRQIIGWDEILEGGLAPNATVMSWRGTQGAVDAAKQHHNVILTPVAYCYFDYYQSENPQEPLAIGGFTSLEKVYDFDPIPEELTRDEAQYVLGGQANVWTEYIPNKEQAEYMVFPRILAMSEVLWTYKNRPEYNDFVKRVVVFQKRMDALNINYANHLHEIKSTVSGTPDEVKYSLSQENSSGTIHYTTDGSNPTMESTVYNNPIALNADKHIKAVVFENEAQKGYVFEEQLKNHKALQQTITLSQPPHKNFSKGGKEVLLNGKIGSSTRFSDKEWLGWWGDDIEITIEFDKPKEINTISTRFHNENGQWIYAPKYIAARITLENDDVIANKFMVQENYESPTIPINLTFSTQSKMIAKKIQLIIPNYGIIPKGKQGAGYKAWTFIDEIIVN